MRDTFDADFEAVVAGLADPASLPAAVDGVDAVYVATNSTPELPDLEGSLARAAGRRHRRRATVRPH